MKRAFQRVLFWSVAIATALASCVPKTRIVTEMPLPQREIVFQSGFHGFGPLGFINSDGSGLIYMNLRQIHVPWWPTWTSDGQYLLFGYYERFCLGTIDAEGRLRIWPRFGLLGHAAPIEGTHQAILVVGGGERGQYRYIYQVDIETGKNLRTWVAAANSRLKIGTNAMYEGKLIYIHTWDNKDGRQKSQLILMDTKTGEKRMLLEVEGWLEAPAFSPTGEWIAYTSPAGIHLIKPDGSENHLILKERLSQGTAPAASWSPDGKWIVFHRCLQDKDRCYDAESFAIFKLNVKTLEEQLLVHGGVYPYWRLAQK